MALSDKTGFLKVTFSDGKERYIAKSEIIDLVADTSKKLVYIVLTTNAQTKYGIDSFSLSPPSGTTVTEYRDTIYAYLTENTVISDVNLKNLKGNAIESGTGAASSATLRTVTASDSPEIAKLEEIVEKIESLEGGYGTLIGKQSGGDFTTARNATNQITVDNLPPSHTTLIAEDIEKVVKIADADGARTEYIAGDGTDGTYLITVGISGAQFIVTVTGMTSSTNDDFIIYTNVKSSSGGGASSGVSPNYFIGMGFDGDAAFASSTTISVTGTSFTVHDGASYVAIIYYKPSGGEWQSPIINGINGASITASSNTITVANAGTPFAAGDEYVVGILYQDKAFDASTNSNINSNLDQPYVHMTSTVHIDEDNEGAQNDTKYTRHEVICGTFNYMSLTYLLTSDDTHNDVTLDVYATNKSDYTVPDEDTAIVDSDEIFNISEEVLGNASGITINNGTVGDEVVIDQPSKFEAIIIELKYEEDNTGAPANAADIRYIQYY